MFAEGNSVFQACAVVNSQTDGRDCLFLVPRLTPVERPSSLLWSAVLCAVVRVTRTVLPSVPSCELYLGHCAVDLLCNAHDDSSSMNQENCCCTVISIHFIKRGSGAVAGAALVDARLLERSCVRRNLSEMECFQVCLQVVRLSTKDAQFSRSLSFLLAQVLSGPFLQLMMNVGEQNGLEAWRLLVRSEQPVFGVNKIADMQSIMQFMFSPGIDKLEEELRTFDVLACFSFLLVVFFNFSIFPFFIFLFRR